MFDRVAMRGRGDDSCERVGRGKKLEGKKISLFVKED